MATPITSFPIGTIDLSATPEFANLQSQVTQGIITISPTEMVAQSKLTTSQTVRLTAPGVYPFINSAGTSVTIKDENGVDIPNNDIPPSYFDTNVYGDVQAVFNHSTQTWTLKVIFNKKGRGYDPKFLSPTANEVLKTGINELSLSNFKPGYYYNWITDILTDNPAYRTSNPVPVIPSTVYKIKGIQHIIWFDENLSKISFDIGMDNAATQVSSPGNAAFAIINVNTNDFYFVKGDVPIFNNYSGNTRFYTKVAETARTDRFPLWDEIPLSQALINLGLNKFLINGYLDFKMEDGFLYSFASIYSADKKINLVRYRRNSEINTQEAELLFLGEFVSEPIDGSDYHLATCTTLPGSWFIVDWRNITGSLSNLYAWEGWALNPKIFKGGVNGLFLRKENIEEYFEDVFTKAISSNIQQWPEDNFINDNDFQIFSGWGCHIGVVKNFDAVELCLQNGSDDDTITKVRVAIYANNFGGALIADTTLTGLNIAARQMQYVTIPLPANIPNASNTTLFLMYWCDAFVVRKAYMGTYPFTVSAGYEYDQYSVNGNMDGATPGSNGNGYPFYFKAGLISEFVLSDNQIANIKDRLNLQVKDIPQINLPQKIYAIVGDTLQLFFRGIIQAVDPYKYDILVTCSKGKKYPRYFQYIPTIDDVGTTTFTITLRDNNLNVLATETCQLITKNTVAAPTTMKKVAVFGDSLTHAWIVDHREGVWPAEADRRLTGSGGLPTGKALANIDFIGAYQTNGTGYYGEGGWQWENYTTSGAPAYRFTVNGISSLSIGAQYTNNGNTFTIKEVNVTNGSGNILCSVTNASPAPNTSGVLTKSAGGGDASINFTASSLDSQNPLWDSVNNKMSFIPYVNNYAGGSLDVVYTFLTWNGRMAGQTDFTTDIAQLKKFADTLHTDFPNAKLKVMGIQVPSVCGMGENYGATGSYYADGYGMVVTAFNLNKAYQEFANRPDYSGFVEYVDIASQVDTEVNAQYEMRPANIRTTITERIDINGIHPDIPGYHQFSDVVFRNFIANYCQ